MDNHLKHILVFSSIALIVVFLGVCTLRTKTMGQTEERYDLITAESSDRGWYYEIYHDTILLIRQRHIPAVKGLQYFVSEQDASKTGELVIDKLKKRQSPSVSISELYQYGITFKE